MNAIGTELKDAYIITTNIFEDERGSFMESFNLQSIQKIIGPYEFVQDNHSKSCKSVLRGLHYQIQYPQGKLVRCIFGSIFDVIVDLRKTSPTFGKWFGTELSESNVHLWVPPGFAHGFYTLTETAEVCYKTTEYYCPEHQRTLMWNDHDLNINWHLSSDPILSKKDINGISFNQLIEDIHISYQ